MADSRKKVFEHKDETKPLQLTIKGDEKKFIPPDGGWGWCVLIGSFSTLVLCSLPPSGFSILFSPLWISLNTSSTTIAWTFNSHVCIWSVTSLIAGPLCEEFGWRKIAFIGGIMNALSIILSGFASSAQFLLFSYSTLGGIAGSLGLASSTFIVSKYFLKRRGFALGIMTLGVCAGGFVSPLLSNFLLANYGFRGSCLIFGGLLLNQCVAAALYQPIERHFTSSSSVVEDDDDIFKPNENIETDIINLNDIEARIIQAKELRAKLTPRLSETSQYTSGLTEQSAIAFISVMDNKTAVQTNASKCSCLIFITIIGILKSTFKGLKCLRSLRVIFIALSAGCLTMGFVNFQMWIPFVVIDAGHTLEISAWCMSLSAILNAISRIAISVVVDYSWFNVRIVYMIGILLISSSIAAFPLRVELIYLIICVSCWGFSLGMTMSLYSTSIINTLGEDLFPTVFGVCSLTTALFFIVVGPILGVVQDSTSNYYIILWMVSSITALGALFWLLMPLATNYDKKREENKHIGKKIVL